MRFFSWKFIISFLAALFFIAGGYIGYLSALVDLDEVQFLEQVKAVTDKARLEKQLARAKSILEARSRAYIRRSQEFIRKKQAENSRLIEKEKKPEQAVTKATEILSTVQPELLNEVERKEYRALQEEKKDLDFFQDEVNVIEEILAREVDEEEINLLFSGQRQRRRVSDSLRQLFLLLDKQRELSSKRQEVKDGFQYWEQHPKLAPQGILIAVHNKGSVKRDLDPLHVTQITTALSVMPQGFDQRLQNLYIVYGDPQMRRGMTGLGVVFMKGEELDFFRVLIHELGHAYDLHREVAEGSKSDFYDGQYRLFNEDPSVIYYRYSWADNIGRLTDLPGFASSYGMTDPFEDFAEAFALYILQGNTFQSWRRESHAMDNKYSFLNGSFDGRNFTSEKQYFARPFEVTMLYVNYLELLQ